VWLPGKANSKCEGEAWWYEDDPPGLTSAGVLAPDPARELTPDPVVDRRVGVCPPPLTFATAASPAAAESDGDMGIMNGVTGAVWITPAFGLEKDRSIAAVESEVDEELLLFEWTFSVLFLRWPARK